MAKRKKSAHRSQTAFAGIRSAIRRHEKELLALPNVIEVRPGFKFTGGWITEQPAIVLTVLRKLPPDELKPKQHIPAEVDGIPTDVAPASPAEQLQHLGPKTRGFRAAPPVPELYLPGVDREQGSGTRGALRGLGANNKNYKKPPKLQLKEVNDTVNLICHASPDAGWPKLREFLGGIKSHFTFAMYDFTATHVFKSLKDSMVAAKGELQVCYDAKGSSERAGEMSEAEVMEGLQRSLKKRCQIAKAGVGVLFPNAYHIKVAVRDSKAFWISSGNWQGSNQPDADASKLAVADQRKLLTGRNREWHVIAEHPGLAQMFEKYIQWDMSEAARVASRGELSPQAPEPDLFVKPELLTRAAPTPVQIFPPLVLKATKVRIQPLLSPDNYGDFIVPLIKSAKKTLYFQNQYILYGPNGGVLDKLVDAMHDRIKHGVDVKIILRDGDTRKMLEALQNKGFRADQIKLQRGCHNKGIVIDSKVAVVSSQNWSGDGVQFNRDAGLIMYHPAIAKYYEKIFLYDWNNRARQKATAETAMPSVVPPAAARGKKRALPSLDKISWSDFHGD
ncbi:MAG: phospholipase D-like domain-containing protein [Pirellulaceae bacterium]